MGSCDRLLSPMTRPPPNELITELDAKGLPDPQAYADLNSLAYHIASRDLPEDFVPTFRDEQRELKDRAEIPELKKIEDQLYSGHNGKSREIMVSELTEYGTTKSVDWFIRHGRYRNLNNPWWKSSDGLANISSTTSKSPLLKACGENSGRDIFWLKGKDGLDLDNVRIAVNWKAEQLKNVNDRVPKIPQTVEVIAKDKNGNWEPFLYSSNEQWKPLAPQRSVNGVPVRDYCIRCHVDTRGNFSPRPSFLKNENDFKGVGYTDPSLIRKLMAY
jgi:hypothetical protein